ncbi:MAG: DUF2905 domain-containing protein [Candidatus Omnitrophota bacterium]|nr:MAG: DUF2905 domain-containing protein [Candidatus Omnitrophota bacterium]
MLGKYLVIFGILLIALGIFLQFFDKIPFLGKLPGDIYIKRGNFNFYFPLTTCLLISAAITIVLYLLTRK